MEIYVILDEDHKHNISNVPTHSHRNFDDALANAKDVAKFTAEQNNGSITGVYLRYENEHGREVKDLIGYSVVSSDEVEIIENFTVERTVVN